MEYFFKDYNDTYNIESNSATRSILSFKNISYHKKSNNNIKENKINNINENISSWAPDSGTSYHMTGN